MDKQTPAYAVSRLRAGMVIAAFAAVASCSEDTSGARENLDVTSPPHYPEGSVVEADAPIELPGAGSVSDSGSASYSIPLRVPAGPGGTQPSLSLVYGGGGN